MNEIELAEPETTSWRTYLSQCMGPTLADRRNLTRFAILTLIWAASSVLATELIERNPEFSLFLRIVIGSVPLLFVALTFFSYLKYLRETDELARQIQMTGLSYGFGAGVVYGMIYMMAEKIEPGFFTQDDALIVMLVSWSIGQVFAAWWYR